MACFEKMFRKTSKQHVLESYALGRFACVGPLAFGCLAKTK